MADEKVLLRFYLRSGDHPPFAPTHERIVKAARNQHMSGATVLKGILGYGSRGLLHESAWTLAEHLPVIVEIVDNSERVVHFLNELNQQQIVHGLATLERAAVMMYRPRSEQPHASLQLAEMRQPLSTLPAIQETPNMTINQNGVLLRVFIGESDRHEHQPLYEAIVRKGRELGLAGATVLRGIEGFGANSLVHRSGILAMSTDLPIVVEIVESEENINRLLPHLEAMVQEGMITMEYVVVLLYRYQDKEK
jgi:PII-like signaling protein